MEYLIFPQQWAEVFCEGFDSEEVARVLVKQGHLVREDSKHFTKRHRVPGEAAVRRYFTIKPSVLDLP